MYHKYDMNQKMWFIRNNKIEKGNIYRIDISITESHTVVGKKQKVETVYFICGWKDIPFNEYELFNSKEELLNSL